MVCVDTDFLIDLKDQDQSAMEKIEELYLKGEEVFTTAINVAEFYFGVFKLKRDKEIALAAADKFLRPFSVLDLDRTSGKLYGELSERTKSNTLGEAGLFIASIAIVNKQTLLTRNIRHFERVPGLQIESW